MKSNNKSQAGFSIVAVLVALAFVGAGTTFIMDLNKRSKVQSALVRKTTFTEIERRRLSAILSDSATCSLAANLGGQPAVRPINSLVTLNGGVLIAKNVSYYNNMLTVSSIETRVLLNPGALANTPKQYELVINYSESVFSDSTANRSSYLGKKNTIIRIPMFINKNSSGNVTDCYAITETSDIDTVVNNVCSPATTSTLKHNVLSLTTQESANKSISCLRNMGPGPSFPSTFTASVLLDCPAGTAISGFSLTSATGSIDFPVTLPSTAQNCTALNGFASTSCTSPTRAWALNSTTLSCDNPGSSRDLTNVCSTGQILYHSSGTSVSCVTVNCPTANEFVQTVTSSGATCYSAPATTCPANQYVMQFNQTGSDVCGILPAFNGSCAASNYGVSITRATATAGGTLNCSAYNKAKSCSPSGVVTFMNGMDATGAATCTTF